LPSLLPSRSFPPPGEVGAKRSSAQRRRTALWRSSRDLRSNGEPPGRRSILLLVLPERGWGTSSRKPHTHSRVTATTHSVPVQRDRVHGQPAQEAVDRMARASHVVATPVSGHAAWLRSSCFPPTLRQPRRHSHRLSQHAGVLGWRYWWVGEETLMSSSSSIKVRFWWI